MARLGPKAWRWGTLAGLVAAGAAFGASGCLGSTEESTRLAPPTTVERAVELPVLGAFVGSFDGEELTILPADAPEAAVMAPGVNAQALVDLVGEACGGGVSCTGTNRVGVESISNTKVALTNGVESASSTTAGGWATFQGSCGGTPSSSQSGVCQQIRVRNLYGQQLERAYIELNALAVSSTTTSVFIPAPVNTTSPNSFTGTSDFGLSPVVTNGLWRVGEMGDNSPTGSGTNLRWAFWGTTPAGQSFRFTFGFVIRGLLVNGTQRATLAGVDAPGSDYPSRTTGASSTSNAVAISSDGRYVVFVSASNSLTGQGTATHVVRHDMTNGSNALATVNSAGTAQTCTAATVTNPHISADGNIVVFSAGGASCDLAGLGAPPTTPQIYAHDFSSGGTILVSRDTAGSYADATSTIPRVSGDGNVVVFQSAATDLDPDYPVGRTACTEGYRYDIPTDSMFHFSAPRGSDIFGGGGWSACTSTLYSAQQPDLNSDGTVIAFLSRQRLDVVDSDTNADVYVYDHNATNGVGTVELWPVSRTSGGAQLSGSGTAASANAHHTISPDGSLVAFTSDHTNVLGAGSSTTGRRHVYRRSAAEGDNSTIVRVDDTVLNTEANGTGVAGTSFTSVAMSSSGRFLAFWSAATNLASVTGFTPSGTQLYVCDMDSSVVLLRRCWVASTAQPTAAGSFSNLTGTAATGSRIGMAYGNDTEAGFVVYQASPSGWGTTLNGSNQTIVSPIGDPRGQAVSPSP